MLNCNS